MAFSTPTWYLLDLKLSFVISLISILLFSFSNQSFAGQVRFATLEWPPFTSQELKDQGVYALIAKEAFKNMGHELVLDFYPWSRAVKLGQNDPKYTGYFPKYYDKSLEENFIFSDPIGSSIIGFVELKSKPIIWNDPKDLKPYRIGTVRGYVNTEQLDKMFSNKQLNDKPAVSDLINLKKLMANHLDLAIIDKNVLDYLLHTNTDISKFKARFQFNKKTLENKRVYLLFKKTSEGKKWHTIFNEGLKKVNIKKMTDEYINSFSRPKEVP